MDFVVSSWRTRNSFKGQLSLKLEIKIAKLKSTSIYTSYRLTLIVHNKKNDERLHHWTDGAMLIQRNCYIQCKYPLRLQNVCIIDIVLLLSLLSFSICCYSQYQCYWYYYIPFLLLLSLINYLVIWRNIPPSKANTVYFFPVLMTNFKYQIIHKEMTYHRPFQKAEVQHLLRLYW